MRHLRRERATVREWNGQRVVNAPAVRCAECGAAWPRHEHPTHRPGCLDAEMRKASP